MGLLSGVRLLLSKIMTHEHGPSGVSGHGPLSVFARLRAALQARTSAAHKHDVVVAVAPHRTKTNFTVSYLPAISFWHLENSHNILCDRLNKWAHITPPATSKENVLCHLCASKW
jgi:hypothetical protein